jgi:hypothetical protein
VSIEAQARVNYEPDTAREPCTVATTPTGFLVDCNEPATIAIESQAVVETYPAETVDDADYVIEDDVEVKTDIRRKIMICHKNRVRFVTLSEFQSLLNLGAKAGDCEVAQ